MIRIITEPSVRLVGRQAIDESALDDFLKDEGVEGWQSDTEVAGQKLVEVAGRLCYHSYAKPRPGGNAAYIGHILEAAHGSVLEHCVFNFIIVGVSRSFTHELVRHRAGWAYSQRSQRFVDESNVAFVVPPALIDVVAKARAYVESKGYKYAVRVQQDREADRLNLGSSIYDEVRAGLNWLESVETALLAYEQLASYLGRSGKGTDDRKKAREAARSVLPNCTETQIFVTANGRALRGMIEQRGVPGADAEMRRVAVALARILMDEAPNIVPDYRIVSDVDGEYVSFIHRKV